MNPSIPPERLLTYGKLQTMVDHPSTPPNEAMAAKLRMRALEGKYPGIGEAWREFQAQADAGTRKGVDWEGIWNGDPQALQALLRVMQQQRAIFEEAKQHAPFYINKAIDTLAASGMEWLTAQIQQSTQELTMSTRKPKNPPKKAAAEEEEVEEVEVSVSVNRKGHVVVTLTCGVDDALALLEDRVSVKALVEEIIGSLEAMGDDGDEEEEDEGTEDSE